MADLKHIEKRIMDALKASLYTVQQMQVEDFQEEMAEYYNDKFEPAYYDRTEAFKREDNVVPSEVVQMGNTVRCDIGFSPPWYKTTGKGIETVFFHNMMGRHGGYSSGASPYFEALMLEDEYKEHMGSMIRAMGIPLE